MIRDGDRDACRTQPAMAAGGGAGFHFGEFERNYVIGENCDQPANGADETRAAFAGPEHGLGEIDFSNDAGERFRQDVEGLTAFYGFAEVVVFALGRRDDFKVGQCDAHLLGEALRGTGTGGFRGAERGLDFVRLGCVQTFGTKYETARGGFRSRDCATEIVLSQDSGEELFQVLECRLDHPVWNFFTADFEQEWQGHQAVTSTATTGLDWSIQAWATPTASFLTRAITPTRSVTLMAPLASSRLKAFEHFSTWS